MNNNQKTNPVTLNLFQTKTVETSWEEIKKLGSDIPSRSIILITLKNGEIVEFEVGYDEKGNQFFVSKDALKDPRPMNNELGSSKNDWSKTDLRSWMNGELFDLLPDNLQKIIVPSKIVQVVNGNRIETEDKLFCLSFSQVFGRMEWFDLSDQEPEDSQIDIFKREKYRVKECGSYGTFPWWLRSADTNFSNFFRCVNSNGNSYDNIADGTRGVVVGFCIQSPKSV